VEADGRPSHSTRLRESYVPRRWRACTPLARRVGRGLPRLRTLLYFRLGRDTQPWLMGLLPTLRKVWKPHPALRFFPERLGPGCFILHGYATGVAAKSIGAGAVVVRVVPAGAAVVGLAAHELQRHLPCVIARPAARSETPDG